MTDFFFAVMLGVTFNCDDLSSTPISNLTWQEPVCAQLNKEYQGVKLTPVKILKVKNDAPYSNDELPKISTLKAGRLKVTINARAEATIVDQVTYLLDVDAYQEVWVLVKSMRSGSVLTEKDVVKRSVNVAPFINVKDFIKENPFGKKLKVGYKRSTILFADSVDAPDLISIGDKLTVKIVDGNMSIETYATALERGTESGHKIKVRLMTTGATFEATIKGNRDVQVDI